ncbi:MAG: GNAT family protein [Pseudomonadota bacterium]
MKRVGDVVFGADEEITLWVSKRIPGFEIKEDARALGIIKDNELVAGCVYDGYNGVHCQGSIAAVEGSRWADRRTMFALFFYPFVTLNCKAVSACAASTNLPSLNLLTKMGFQPEALVKYAAHDASTLVVMKMYRENCKWIGRNGQRQQKQDTGST